MNDGSASKKRSLAVESGPPESVLVRKKGAKERRPLGFEGRMMRKRMARGSSGALCLPWGGGSVGKGRL